MEVENAQPYHSELAPLVDLLEASPELLAVGDINIQNAALQAAKFVFDLGLPFLFNAEDPAAQGILISNLPGAKRRKAHSWTT
jgi:hypothetical protein